MSVKPPSKKVLEVALLRPGCETETYSLPTGSTLGDLLRESRASTEGHDVFINGQRPEENVVLKPDMVVSLAPHLRSKSPHGSWRATIGMFRDDPWFERTVEAGRALREAERNGGPIEES